MKHNTHNWKLRGVLYGVPKFRELWPTNSLKLDRSFLPILCKFCILLHCQVLHTEVSKQNSIKLCKMLGSELDLQMHVNNVSGSPQKTAELKLLIL